MKILQNVSNLAAENEVGIEEEQLYLKSFTLVQDPRPWLHPLVLLSRDA